jgi:aerobic-type carbon monoxide dehydrogenase small subunit (CoxS/CutS family)
MWLLSRGADHAGRRIAGGNTKPSDQDILTGMSGNICRCGCYQRIAEAVRLASTGV